MMQFCKVGLMMGLITGSLTNLYAQESINDPYQPPVFIQTSPEVAAFKRYGDVPVSLYTGVPEISIPLYTVKLKDLEVPISLSYHAGGITVDQDATIVGLGWNLNVGGSITVSTVGRRETPLVGTMWEGWKNTLDFIAGSTGGIVNTGTEWHGQGWGCGINALPPDDVTVYSVATMNGMGELDVYKVSLPNRSFAFVIHPATGEAIFVGEKNKCRIEPYRIHGFKITDENGVQYIFDNVEFNTNDDHMPYAWYLTQIIDVYSNEINFEYQGGSQNAMPQMSEVLRFAYPTTNSSARNFSTPNNVTTNYVKTITTGTQRVSFEYEAGRRDLYGGAGNVYLKGITVTDSTNQTIKTQYKFNYGYFTSSTVGGDYLRDNPGDTPDPKDWKSLRLKLESLSQVNPLNEEDTISHVFTYDERHLLPQKTSFAKDFWGYFNGRQNSSIMLGQHTLLPNPFVMKYVEPDFVNKTWFDFEDEQLANRFSDPEYMSTATIKSITYPTGGKTEFEFEPHEFRDQVMFEAADQDLLHPSDTVISVNDMNDPYGLQTQMKDFQLDETTEVHLVGGGDSTLYNLSGGMIGIINMSVGLTYMYDLGTKSRWDVKFEVPPGSYRLICSAPVDLNDTIFSYRTIVYASLTYKDYDRDAINVALSKTDGIGGGLRVKAIRNFDENGNLVGTKEYSYRQENGKPSGKLLRILDNFQTLTITTGAYVSNPTGGWYTSTYRNDAYTFHANNFLETHNATSSVNVGYDRVLVRDVAGENDLGEVISYFVNESPTKIADYFSIYQNSINGQSQRKVMLNHLRDTVQYQLNYYDQRDYTRNMLNIQAVDTYYGDASGGCGMREILGGYNRYNVVVWAYTNFFNQLVKTETYTYAGSKKFLTRTEYTYDATNYQLDQTRTLTSDNRYRVSQYTYPHDYPEDLVYPLMVEDNVISPVIEQKEYLDSKLLKTQENKFWFWLDSYNQMRIVPGRVKIGYGESIPEEKIIFDKFDLKGNVLQYHVPNENVNTTFFRGHGDNRVVAKIVGTLNYDQVSSTAATYLNQLDDNMSNAQLMSVNTTIRNLLPNALVTTYTYDPLFGITSETDANGITTYYEYDAFGRLMLMKDHDGNIQHQFRYNYHKHTPGQQ